MIGIGLDTPSTLNWLLLALATVLLAVQLWFLVRNKQLTSSRRVLKMALNSCLWLLVVAFVLDLRKPAAFAGPVLIVADNVPSAWTNHLKDSLRVRKHISAEDFEPGISDSVFLAGQDFDSSFVKKISRERPKILKWIPYHRPDLIQELKWEGILRKGQVQQVSGIVHASEKQFIKLSYAGVTLDSAALKKGLNTFRLSFPVFAEGAMSVTIGLESHASDTIRFHARPAVRRTFEFLLDSPDFETTALANWLGKNGHAVKMTTKVSKNVSGNRTINKTSETDIYITDPAHTAGPEIRKALTDGKSILLMGLTDVERDFVVMNNALGSDLNAIRISTEEYVTVTGGLTARPYRFASAASTFILPEIPVAVIKNKGRLGVSLLDETFPLLLSGDSTRYSRIWSTVLARVAPSDTANISIEAPIFANLQTGIVFNNSRRGNAPASFSAGLETMSDTLFPRYSLVNKKTSYASFLPLQNGQWKTLNGPFSGIRFYTESDSSFPEVRQNRFMRHFADSEKDLPNSTGAHQPDQPLISDVLWLILFVASLSFLWIEEKLF